MIGIGIDTGGTCTDAVVYDMTEKKILAAAKSETTRHDLKVGIAAVLEKLPKEALAECGQVALSTTLATNACVENRGAGGKLIFLGVSRKVFDKTAASNGLTDEKDILLVDCTLNPDAELCTEPDWEALEAQLPEFLAGCQCAAIVQLYARELQGRYEEKTRDLIRRLTAEGRIGREIPVLLGRELFQERNVIRRGAGALLNARLIPVIYEFLTAVEQVFHSEGLQVPVTIIRSDGSQMSRDFAMERPVETLLCGPAASVIGASALTDCPEALIVDIGGTTTDIAIVKSSQPKLATGGIQVGSWKTLVKGVYVDTFGLGGDTAVHFRSNETVYLEQYRAIPLCSLASRFPSVLEKLQKMDRAERFHTCWIYEFFVLVHMPEQPDQYLPEEVRLMETLKNGPLSMEEAAEVMGRDLYNFSVDRLEQDGLILRSGLTPTDMMHLKGDYNAYCAEASLCAARIFCRSIRIPEPADLADQVYELVERRLYENLCRILMQNYGPLKASEDLEPQMQTLIDYAWDHSNTPDFAPLFTTQSKLVGVGAPTHVFLPRVAERLRTEAVLPEYAGVANAIGAISSQVIVRETAEIQPQANEGDDIFLVITSTARERVEGYDAAYELAKRLASEQAVKNARIQGAAGALTITEKLDHRAYKLRYGNTWLEDVLQITVTGTNLAEQDPAGTDTGC